MSNRVTSASVEGLEADGGPHLKSSLITGDQNKMVIRIFFLSL